MEMLFGFAFVITVFLLGEIADRRAGHGTTLREHADAWADLVRR
jgi:hypothetical protein